MRRHKRDRRPQPKFTQKISEHFSKKDFVCHCGDCDKSVKVSMGLVGGLELLRSRLNKNRVHIKTGHMCSTAAEKQSKIKRNFHLTGVAADIAVDTVNLVDVFKAAEEIPEFMGIGLNLTDGHVHVDTRKADVRELWVEHGNDTIPLTDDNRSKYLGD